MKINCEYVNRKIELFRIIYILVDRAKMSIIFKKIFGRSDQQMSPLKDQQAPFKDQHVPLKDQRAPSLKDQVIKLQSDMKTAAETELELRTQLLSLRAENEQLTATAAKLELDISTLRALYNCDVVAKMPLIPLRPMPIYKYKSEHCGSESQCSDCSIL